MMFVSSNNQETTGGTHQPHSKDIHTKSLSAPPTVRIFSYTDESLASKKNEKLSCMRKVSKICLGHAPLTKEFIERSKESGFGVAYFIVESVLLSVSNLVFISNPYCSLVILTSLLISATTTTTLGLLSLISGILTSAWIVGIPWEVIRGGSATFNCYLIGTLIGPLIGESGSYFNVPLLLLAISVGIISMFCWGGLHGLLNYIRLPVLNAPCNLLALILMYSGLKSQFRGPSEYHKSPTEPSSNISFLSFNSSESGRRSWNNLSSLGNEVAQDEHWMKVMEGVVLAQGQIFMTNYTLTSSIIFLSVVWYSPILFFQECMGSAVGTLIGVILADKDFVAVYDGSWGFNSLLTSAALGGVFIAFNFQALLLSFVGAILSAFLYAAMINIGVTPLGMPFMITTWILLPLAFLPEVNKGNKDALEGDDDRAACFKLYPVHSFSTPEINQRCLFKGLFKVYGRKKNYNRPKTSSILPL